MLYYPLLHLRVYNKVHSRSMQVTFYSYIRVIIISLILVSAVLLLTYFFITHFEVRLPIPLITLQRDRQVDEWIRNPSAHPQWAINEGTRCNFAPFLIPSRGFIGYLWDDSFWFSHRHQGIDIFGSLPSGQTPVIAAYDGYLTRLPEWKASLIIRVPQDPLFPQRQIWLYYTHLADASGKISYILSEFPPGTSEKFVKAGTLLGYQGNYSGYPNRPVGIHLHFSIVKDNGKGQFLNEMHIENTLDPSPYFGLPLDAYKNKGVLPICH